MHDSEISKKKCLLIVKDSTVHQGRKLTLIEFKFQALNYQRGEDVQKIFAKFYDNSK